LLFITSVADPVISATFFSVSHKVQRHPAEPCETVPGEEVILGFIVKTETLTDRLVKLLHALESVQASIVE
jgi:hypothetical protein